MGRSRGNFQAEEDSSQRSRRRTNASNGEHLESANAGQGTAEGKRALYHCNYCKKDITGRTPIKCAECSDFDLCIEYFSVGAEVHPHKSNHHYRVMGIEMYGMWKWAEVGEHVGTKTMEACIDNFRNAYLNSPYFPLLSMAITAEDEKVDTRSTILTGIKRFSLITGSTTLAEAGNECHAFSGFLAYGSKKNASARTQG